MVPVIRGADTESGLYAGEFPESVKDSPSIHRKKGGMVQVVVPRSGSACAATAELI
jgi:hypothetical protein